MPQIVTIQNDHWRVGLVPSSGGSVAFGQVKVGDDWVDVMRPTPEPDLVAASKTASYPLVPWSNRIREGKLKWQGRTYQLRVNFPDGTACHGTGTEYPWAVVEQEQDRVVLEFTSRNVYGVNFPWTFTARFEYALEGNTFVWRMGLTNTDHETFPAGLGHHPYFLRQLTGADASELGGPAQLQINCATGYDLTDCMASGPAGEIRPEADFRELRPLGDAFVDDCLTGRDGALVSTVDYPGALRIDIEADTLLSHVVVYVPQQQEFFAVEPVTNANDGFALDDAGVPGSGVFVVQPGETRTATFSFAATVA